MVQATVCFHLLAATGSGAELRHVLVKQYFRRSLSVKKYTFDITKTQQHGICLQ